MRPNPLPDSPIVDAIRLASALKRRLPGQGDTIDSAMWKSVSDYYAASGGHALEDGPLPIMAPISPIWCICPMRAMALLC
jgi:hypothetical protein